MRRFWFLAIATCLPVFGAGNPVTIDDALLRLYDFNFPATHEILNQYIAAHPDDPLPHAFRASAYLFSELDRLGILESEFLTDDQRIAEKKRSLTPDPAVREQFLKAMDEVQRRGDSALKANPDDRTALFAMCVAQGVATDYMALVEKRQFSSLSLAKRSNNYAQKLLKLDPKFSDAYVTTGLTEYMVGSLPFFVRWFVRFDNVSGSKERGKEILERAAREGRYFKPFAKILLGIIGLREKRPQDARKLLAELAHDYPNNPLFRKELAKLNSRLGVAAN